MLHWDRVRGISASDDAVVASWWEAWPTKTSQTVISSSTGLRFDACELPSGADSATLDLAEILG